jgi:hypothetical protein
MQGHGTLVVVGFVSAICWVQLFRLVNNTAPSRTTLVLAFGILFLAVAGTGTLVSWYIQWRRFRRDRVVTALRHGGWMGLLIVGYAWLQLADLLTPLIALVLLGIFITAESLLLLRELSL